MLRNSQYLEGCAIGATDGPIGAPPYDAAVALNREQEMGIHQHYKRPGYWTGEVKAVLQDDRPMK